MSEASAAAIVGAYIRTCSIPSQGPISGAVTRWITPSEALRALDRLAQLEGAARVHVSKEHPAP